MEEVSASSLNSPSVSTKCKPDSVGKLIGTLNVSDILVCGVKTLGLIDSGSHVTPFSESFYNSMEPKPPLRDVSEFGISLSVLSASGNKLPYIGFIVADVSFPGLNNLSCRHLLLSCQIPVMINKFPV